MRFLETPQMDQYEQQVGLTRQMSVSTAATPFGCCDYFDNCADEILTLYYKGVLGLLDWMGFDVTTECLRSVDFLTYVRPEQSQGSDTGGYLSDPCADPNGVEFGACSLSVEDFGRYGRAGMVRDLFKPERYCKTRPRRFLDGSALTSEFQWDMIFVMDQILNDIRSHLIIGNANTAGQFDGLQRWVRTGYDCPNLDSYVVNWNNNPMAGGAGVTINGNAINPGYDFVDVLLDLIRNVKTRISWSPELRNQSMQTGDMVLLMPDFMARCLLDHYTCWSVCPGAQYEEVVKESREMRDFRDSLNGGMFGGGAISIDGFTIPIMRYDWELINGPTRGDIYLLTGGIGSQRVWEGEHLSANNVLTELGEAGVGNAGDFWTGDGGRYLGKVNVEGTCRQMMMWMRPRLWCYAPWAQIRFQNVACHTPSGPLSPDPGSSFFPETSFHQAACP